MQSIPSRSIWPDFKSDQTRNDCSVTIWTPFLPSTAGMKTSHHMSKIEIGQVWVNLTTFPSSVVTVILCDQLVQDFHHNYEEQWWQQVSLAESMCVTDSVTRASVDVHPCACSSEHSRHPVPPTSWEASMLQHFQKEGPGNGIKMPLPDQLWEASRGNAWHTLFRTHGIHLTVPGEISLAQLCGIKLTHKNSYTVMCPWLLLLFSDQVFS